MYDQIYLLGEVTYLFTEQYDYTHQNLALYQKMEQCHKLIKLTQAIIACYIS